MMKPILAARAKRHALRALFSLLALSFAATGCNLNVNPDRASGADGERYSSPAAKLNEVYLDSVDYDNGDATDWRYILVGQQGILSVTCHFDELGAKTVLHVRDSVGNILATQFNSGQDRQVATAKVMEGKYYIEVKALEEGAISPYTCEPRFDPVVWN